MSPAWTEEASTANEICTKNANRSVVQINLDGSVQVTNTNAYSGNNGRSVILANNVNGTGQSQYLMVGNAGNGGSPPPVKSSTTPACSRSPPAATVPKQPSSANSKGCWAPRMASSTVSRSRKPTR